MFLSAFIGYFCVYFHTSPALEIKKRTRVFATYRKEDHCPFLLLTFSVFSRRENPHRRGLPTRVTRKYQSHS